MSEYNIGNHTDLSLTIGELGCTGNHDTSNRIEFASIRRIVWRLINRNINIIIMFF